MLTALITTDPISAGELAKSVESDKYGAIVTFSGNVRNNDGDKVVISLTYEVHPMAQDVLLEIITEVSTEYDVGNVAAAHRYGSIPIGESAFILAVSAIHRGPALAACSRLVDEIKSRLPIWKYQVFADGSSEWVNTA